MSDPTPTPTPAPDPAPTPAPAPSPTPPTPPPAPAPGNAPDSRAEARVREALEAKTAAETARAEAEARVKELEERDLDEKQKAEKRATEAEARASAAEANVVSLTRNGWIRSIAAEANFADPDDAVAHLAGKLDKLDSEAKVKEAVGKLAESKKHLVKGEAPAPTPAGFGSLFGGGGGPVPPGLAGPASADPNDPEQAVEAAKSGIAADIGAILSGRRARG